MECYLPLASLLDILYNLFHSKYETLALFRDFMDDFSVDIVAAVVIAWASATRECMDGMEQYYGMEQY